MLGKSKGKIAANEHTECAAITDVYTQLYDIPKICAFDFKTTFIKEMKQMHFDVFDASLGKIVNIDNKPNTGRYCLLNGTIPDNLHEYDIFIYNMFDIQKIEYVEENNVKKTVADENDYYLFCEYPANIFNPRAYNALNVREAINYSLDKNRVTIVFANVTNDTKYSIVKKGPRYVEPVDNKIISNYSFLPHDVYHKENKSGRKITVSVKNPVLNAFFSKYIKDSEYNITFYHPTYWDHSKHVPDESFFPLLVNDTNEIISYIKIKDKNWTIVLPNLKSKEEVVKELISNVLPDFIPELFPHNEKLSWQFNKTYYLPNEEQLLLQEEEIIKRHECEKAEIKNKIEGNRKQYTFLHAILTDTGDSLVKNLITYFQWLGFSNIKNMDEYLEEVKEEDIQIELVKGLLIIEAKGIGGTSRDDECAQISKIRSRRCEERNKFDIIALYIVNHQRHIPPIDRKNPPFTDNQIHDAELDKRGLITTWALFNLYFDIENGIITKQRAIECLLTSGLVKFNPDKILKIGIIKEIYQNGEIAIFDLVDYQLQLKDQLAYFNGNKYIIFPILSMQVNNRDVTNAEKCEVGIKTNIRLKSSIEIFVIKNA